MARQPTQQIQFGKASEWYFDPNRTPQELRAAFRREEWTGPTKGMALGYVILGPVILPRADAYDFLVFCIRNPIPFPLVEVTEPGNPMLSYCAPGADVRTDLPKYHIFKNGELVEEAFNIMEYWQDDLVSFLIGTTASADGALVEAGVTFRQLEETRSPLAFMSNISVHPAGRFQPGNLVVSTRPMPPAEAIRAVQVTTRFPEGQSAPIHIGNPAAIGIRDVRKPDFGVPVTFKEGDTTPFWAGNVTAVFAAVEAKIDFMITHAPGHMFISDLADAMLALL